MTHLIRQKIIVQSGNQVDFILKVQQAILDGARIDESVGQRVATFPHSCTMYVEGPNDDFSWFWKSSPGIIAYPIDNADKIYTKEALAELDWNEFKKVMKSVGIDKGRDRGVMGNKYFEITGQNEKKTSEKIDEVVTKSKKVENNA